MMPRTARLTFKGGFYHIFNRGLNKSPIFVNDSDYEKILKRLSLILKEGDWIIYAYCLMPTHYHFLVEEHNSPIAKLMSRLLTSYSLYFNKKYKRLGPLFQDRFKSKLIQKDSYFLAVSRYIHLNPVKDGLSEKAEGYKYSSLIEYTGKIQRDIIHKDKIGQLLEKENSGMDDYLEFVREGIKEDLDEYDPFKVNKDVIGSIVFSTHRKMRHFGK